MLPWNISSSIVPPTAEEHFPGIDLVSSSVDRLQGWGLCAHFLNTSMVWLLLTVASLKRILGSLVYGRGVPLRPLCLLDWNRCKLALAGTWPWGKGNFIIKKNPGSSVFFSPHQSWALPPEQSNFNIWPNFKNSLLANPNLVHLPVSSWIHDGGSVKFSVDLAAGSRSQLGQRPLLVTYLSIHHPHLCFGSYS